MAFYVPSVCSFTPNHIPQEMLLQQIYLADMLNHKEEGRNVLLNDALNTFYLRLYGIGTYGKGPLR